MKDGSHNQSLKSFTSKEYLIWKFGNFNLLVKLSVINLSSWIIYLIMKVKLEVKGNSIVFHFKVKKIDERLSFLLKWSWCLACCIIIDRIESMKILLWFIFWKMKVKHISTKNDWIFNWLHWKVLNYSRQFNFFFAKSLKSKFKSTTWCGNKISRKYISMNFPLTLFDSTSKK